MSLTPDELRRYARHLVLPMVGAEGQERLAAASVLIVGLGGLGSPAALYLAAAGVGRLGLVDDDRVDESNLQRQVLHGTSGVGRRKVDSAIHRLRDLNSHVQLVPHAARLTPHNALAMIGAYDVVLDGTDQFAVRYLVNDACVITGKPNVYGSVHRFEGQVSVFNAAGGPCYRCLFPEPPAPGSVPNCAEGGVLGVLPGIVGSLQATEAIKLILGIGESLVGRLLHLDALTMRTHEVGFDRDPACPMCGATATRRLLDDYDAFCGVPSPGGARHEDDVEVTPQTLKDRRAGGWAPLLLDVREPWEHATARLEGSTLIPLGELARRAHEVPQDRDVVVYCHHGMRSAHAVSMLRLAGWSRVFNLSGGIDRWSIEADRSVPRY
ncbi:MAG: molybdopterin-synthase adenylyltransferase MoeB [Gemmatimonadaceae bacterium]|nr:molybdopterin-synthase adenylyltransferase MoeB [Gemmatimonadaceae bacterium]